MPVFQYQAIDTRGKEQKGRIFSPTLDDAREKIKEQGFFPTRIDESEDSLPFYPSPKKINFLPKRLIFSDHALGIFTRQLAILTKAGVPLVRSLKILQEQEKSSSWQKMTQNLIQAIENGSAFSEALSQHPRIFNNLYISMARVGEMNGDLATSLSHLAELMEKTQRLQRKVISALIYPIIVLFLAIGVLTVFLAFIAPRFKMVFESLLGNRPLPLLTQWVIYASAFARNNIFYAVSVAALLAVLLKIVSQIPRGALWMDRIKLKIPLLGDLLLKNVTARFCRVLATMVASGVPLLQAFSIARETSNNALISRAITQIHDHVKEGEAITTAMRAHPVFPVMMMNMIQVGEETGNLADMLEKVANIYEEEVDIAASTLARLLEPIMIISLAIFVGTIVAALFLPLTTLITDLSSSM